MAGGKKLEYVVAPTDTRPDTTIRQGAQSSSSRTRSTSSSARFRLGRHRDARLRQDNPDKDGHQRHLGRARDHLGRPGAELLPLQSRRRAMGTGPRLLRREHQGLEEGRNDRGRLLVRLPNFLASRSTSAAPAATSSNASGFPLGSSDFGGIIAQLPDDVDAIYLGVGGTDANQLPEPVRTGRRGHQLIGRHHHGRPDRPHLQGQGEGSPCRHPTSGALAEDNNGSGMAELRQGLSGSLPRGRALPTPSLFGVGYYNATLAAIAALNEVGGDLSDGQKKFQASLAALKLETRSASSRSTRTARRPAPSTSRGGGECRRHTRQQDGRQAGERDPDARHDRCRVPRHGPALARHAGLRGNPHRRRQVSCTAARPGRNSAPARGSRREYRAGRLSSGRVQRCRSSPISPGSIFADRVVEDALAVELRARACAGGHRHDLSARRKTISTGSRMPFPRRAVLAIPQDGRRGCCIIVAPEPGLRGRSLRRGYRPWRPAGARSCPRARPRRSREGWAGDAGPVIALPTTTASVGIGRFPRRWAGLRASSLPSSCATRR